jgi:U3 small nucleolar RNA-associated protein 18
MPRQRSKKTSASRITEQAVAQESASEEEQSENDNDSPDIMEKDSDEEELDRLVLGDGARFKAQLGMGMDVDQGEYSKDKDSLVEAQDGEAEFENVDDADVGILVYAPRISS